MNCKKINKEYRKSISFTFNLNLSDQYGCKNGIIYTLYSEKLNLIEVGFAESNSILETKLFGSQFVLLDKNQGEKKDLHLLISTLNELGIKLSSNLNLKYSEILIRHLSTLGWPIGRSLYKPRRIKKELSRV